MIKYFPIWIDHEIKCSRSDMTTLRWKGESIIADFWIPGDEANRLRVQFASVHVIRVLDEFWISTEEPPPSDGHVPDHFAYRVEGSRFWECQSEAAKATYPEAKHYLFVTGSACLDVVSSAPPEILAVPAEASEHEKSI